MERSVIRERQVGLGTTFPDYAALHPGYKPAGTCSATAESKGRGHDSKHPRVVDAAVEQLRSGPGRRQYYVIGRMNAAVDIERQIAGATRGTRYIAILLVRH